LLGSLLVYFDAQVAEAALEHFGGLEDESSHAKPLSGLGISRDIINVDGFLKR